MTSGVPAVPGLTKAVAGRAAAFACTLLLFLAASACSTEDARREFVWDEDVARLTGRQLGDWLRKAPFENEFGEPEDGSMVITNARQVFPFVGRYFDAEGELRQGHGRGEDGPVFMQETVLYEDPEWGDLFVDAALLYEAQEAFLADSYVDVGNPLFGGGMAEAATTYHATLQETSVVADNGRYKTVLYRANVAQGDYLLGFYQQGQLIFSAAVPFRGPDEQATLEKMRAVGRSLGLDVAEWERATVEQLQAVDAPRTFWEDPFVGLYRNAWMLHDVYLKIGDTPFERMAAPTRGDHAFSYRSPQGTVELRTELKDTDHGEAAFNQSSSDLDRYEYRQQPVYYREARSGDYTEGVATTYLGDNRYIEMHYRFPSADEQARANVHGVLRRVRVSRP